MSKVVEVLDGVMGSGKTTKILEWIDNNPSRKFLLEAGYLSPIRCGWDNFYRNSKKDQMLSHTDRICIFVS